MAIRLPTLDQLANGEYMTYDANGDEMERLALQTVIAYEREGKPLDVDAEGHCVWW